MKLGWHGALGFVGEEIHRRHIVRPRDLIQRGVPHSWLYDFASMEIKKIGPGLFTLRSANPDPLLILARKYPGLTLGVTSALWAHDLIERPAQDWWIMGNNARRPRLPCERARFLRSSWPREDTDPVELFYARAMVVTQSPVRALLDCLRFRKKLGEEQVDAAFRAALHKNVVNTAVLEMRAAELHIYHPLKAKLRSLGR